jgi:hypothetical protein
MGCNETKPLIELRKIMTIKTPVAVIKSRIVARKVRRYEAMIAASQAKLAETTLVPGYTNVYA